MKSAKDFAEAWGVNSQNAGRRLSGKSGKGKYALTPVKKVGAILLYSDEDFERLTGVKCEKIDFSGLMCPADLGERLGIKTKSALQWLYDRGVKPVVKEGGVNWYKKSDIEAEMANAKRRRKAAPSKPKIERGSETKRLNDFSIFSHRVSVFANGRWIVKRFGMRDGDCLELVKKLLQSGEDILIRSYWNENLERERGDWKLLPKEQRDFAEFKLRADEYDSGVGVRGMALEEFDFSGAEAAGGQADEVLPDGQGSPFVLQNALQEYVRRVD